MNAHMDPLRSLPLHKHLVALHAAISVGVDVRGCCACSLFDNLLWTHACGNRCGLVSADDASQRRTRKTSALARGNRCQRAVRTPPWP
jgi:beta-glucosidase